jgi:hypothetical protein
MIDTGKILIGIGVVVAIIGVLVWALGRLGFHGLPGDIRYESSRLRVYFPIVTCIVLSAVLTAAMWVWQWFARK